MENAVSDEEMAFSYSRRLSTKQLEMKRLILLIYFILNINDINHFFNTFVPISYKK